MIAHAYQFTPNEDLTEPYVALACAMLEQTIQDIHILRRAGVLVNGKLAKKLPQRGRSREIIHYANYYSHAHTVEELIDFIRGPYLGQLIEWAGVPIVTQEDFIAHLEGRTPLMDGNSWSNQRYRR